MSSEPPEQPAELLIRVWKDNRKQVAQLGKYLPDDADEDTQLRYGYRVAAFLIQNGVACPSGLALGDQEFSMRDLHDKFGSWKDI